MSFQPRSHPAGAHLPCKSRVGEVHLSQVRLLSSQAKITQSAACGAPLGSKPGPLGESPREEGFNSTGTQNGRVRDRELPATERVRRRLGNRSSPEMETKLVGFLLTWWLCNFAINSEWGKQGTLSCSLESRVMPLAGHWAGSRGPGPGPPDFLGSQHTGSHLFCKRVLPSGGP